MNYKLAKDLPYAKAGTEVKINRTGIYLENVQGVLICLDSLGGHSSQEEIQSELSRLIKEGWIVEDKPEERWINSYLDGVERIHKTKQEAISQRGEGGITKHFREVIKED